MLSSSPTFFAPPFLSSLPPPSRTSRRISPALSATTAASSHYTRADDPPRLRQIPRRLSSSATASLYEILEIPVGSTSQEIKSAYRRLARNCHPDVAGNGRSAGDEFVKIHAAYCTLSDPEKRAVYDRRILLRLRSRPLSVGGSYIGGNWETDQCW
ncbi:Chaperone DnaJ-domain superfamily protein [Raphanus sativus]|uniref:Chaperone protein dnaJ 11, chloroplastic n=1 Tax=Raphanus sativus TaxID=3726 RepID=A0A6J0L0M7_RAPSA|nr:chaperone protein dnaJ 11, chloroplastic [Raphanus sativus]KAJ4876887.1 Chaperone DnaJ-domain superfamily protein [Raphanus sativus]